MNYARSFKELEVYKISRELSKEFFFATCHRLPFTVNRLLKAYIPL